MNTKAQNWNDTILSPVGNKDPVPRVTALEVAAIKRMRQRTAELRAELGELGATLQEREQDVIERLEKGAESDVAAVVLMRRRQSISWLTVVARELGADVVESTKNTWPITFWKELQLA